MRHILFVILMLTLAGCGHAQPQLAGSKWAKALKDSNVQLRRKAAFTLGNIGPSDPAVVPALLEALKDADVGVRTQAILSLVKLGPAAQEAVPALTELARQDRSLQVRVYASQAAAKLREEGGS
jgi:HEAT repeat protein